MAEKERKLKSRQPNIIFWDIETAPLIATTWGLYPKSLSHESILQDWFIICACWKSSNSPVVHSTQITKATDDYQVVKTLGDVIRKADILVHHNGDKFDLKKLNARLIYHNLPPVPLVPTVDTLKEVKKIAAFPSNRLDYLTKTMLGKGKLKTEPDLWMRAMRGNRKAIKDMVAYCKVDVERLEQFYLRLRPYMKTHPHVGVLSNSLREISCSKCGSTAVQKRGISITAAGVKKQRIQCQTCGGYHTIPFKP